MPVPMDSAAPGLNTSCRPSRSPIRTPAHTVLEVVERPDLRQLVEHQHDDGDREEQDQQPTPATGSPSGAAGRSSEVVGTAGVYVRVSDALRAACTRRRGWPAGTPAGAPCRPPGRRTRTWRTCRWRSAPAPAGSATSRSRVLFTSVSSCSRSSADEPESAWSSPAPSPELRSRSDSSASAAASSLVRRSMSLVSSSAMSLTSRAVHGLLAVTHRAAPGRSWRAPWRRS